MMIRGLPVFVLTLLCSATGYAQDAKPCSAARDNGMAVTIRGMSPLGPGTSVVVFAEGIAIWVAPDHAVFLAPLANGEWVGFEGNYIKGKMNERGDSANGSYFDQIDLKKNGGELTIRRRVQPKRNANDPDPDPGYVLRVSRAGFPEKGKPPPAEIRTTVHFESQGGASVASFTSRVPWEQYAAALESYKTLPKDAKEEADRLRKNHGSLPPVGNVNFAEGETNKVRTGCTDQATDLTGQGGGGTPPAGPAAKGG